MDEILAREYVFVQHGYRNLYRASRAYIFKNKTYDLEHYSKVNTPIAVDTLKFEITFTENCIDLNLVFL